MYRQIMVPLDGSNFSAQALSYALGAARRMDATVHFVRVHKPASTVLNAATPWVIDTSSEAEQRKEETDYLEKVAALPRASGLRIATALLEGPVTDALEQYVEQMNIDLVVMTTHGRGGLSRVWLGSVADTLVRNVDVPVLLLRPASVELQGFGPQFTVTNILIPVDGTGFSENVIEHALDIGGLANARYTLVQVVAPPVTLGAEVVASRTADAEFELLRAHTLTSLEQLADSMRVQGAEVSTAVVVQPQAAAGILEYAAECRADLIAMATHGRTGWSRMAMGSVADKVMRATQMPLLLMRPVATTCEQPVVTYGAPRLSA